MTDFERASAVVRVGEGRYLATIPDGWGHGRGAFGGLVLAIMLRAMQGEEPGSRAVRTMSGDLGGPVMPGEVEIRAELLRRGSSQTNLRASVHQGGQILASSLAVLSVARARELRIVPEPPAPADFRDYPVLPMDAPGASPFTRNYEYRNMGPVFFGAGAEARSEGFVVEREKLARVDAAAMVGRLDAFWPTLYAVFDRVHPMATISFAAQMLVDPGTLDPALPLRHRAHARHVGDGFLLEERELWAGETPVAMNQQTFAIIA